MNKTLAIFMSVAGTMIILVALIMGIAYEKLETTNENYQNKMVNFQTPIKE